MSMMYVAVAVSTIVGGISAYRGNQAQQAQYKAQEQANEYNAAVQRSRATEIRNVSGAREDQQRRMARLEAGKRAAAIAESGLGFGGSNADIDDQSSIFAEMDALNIRYEGELEARGMLAQSNISSYHASNDRANRRNAQSNLWLNTATAALSSGSSAYGSFKR